MVRGYLALILLVAAGFRLTALHIAPPAINGDVAFNGTDALDVLRGHLQIFFSGNFGREPIMIYLQAAGTFLYGRNEYGLRFPAAAIGVLTVASMYPLGVRLFAPVYGKQGRWVGILASAITAVSYWHVHWSRLGLRAILFPCFLIVVFYLLLRAFDGRKFGWTAAGIASGVTLYTYLASRLIPVTIGLVLIVFWLTSRIRQPDLSGGAVLRGAARLAVTAALVALPLGLYFVAYPEQFFARIEQVSAVTVGDETIPPADSFAEGIVKTAAMFNFDGGSNYQLFLPGRAVFDWFLGPFFIVGLAAAVFRPARREHWLPLLWFGTMLLPAVLARDRHPDFSRSIGALPPTMLFAASGAFLVVDRAKRLRIQAGRAVPVAAALLLVASAAVTWRDYWFVWAGNPEVPRVFGAPLKQIAEEANREDRPNRWFLLLASPGRAVDFRYRSFDYLFLGQHGGTIRTEDRVLESAVAPALRDGNELWVYDFPPTLSLGADDPIGHADFLLHRAALSSDETDIPGFRRRRFLIGASPQVLVQDPPDVKFSASGIFVTSPGCWLGADGRSLAVSLRLAVPSLERPPDRISIRALDRAGTVAAQQDVPLRDALGRTTGGISYPAIIPVYVVLNLPDGLPPATYRVTAVPYIDQGPPIDAETGLFDVSLQAAVPERSRERVFAKSADTPPVSVKFGDAVGIVGMDVEALGNGDPGVGLTLYWSKLSGSLPDLIVQTTVRDGNRIVATAKRRPGDGTFSSTTWAQSEIVADEYAFPGIPTGNLSLELALFDSTTGDPFPKGSASPVVVGPLRVVG